MANVKDDEFETLDFADESEYIGDEDEPQDRFSAAVEALRDEVAGLDLTDDERETLAWLERWETHTLVNIASVIYKARMQGVYER